MERYAKLDPAQIEQVIPVMFGTFGGRLAGWERLRRSATDEAFRGIEQDGQVIAGCIRLDCAQFWGGQSVPMCALAGVAVPAERRGTGLGGRLMRGLLADLHDDGIALCALFASTQPFYAKLGFERGGTSGKHEIPLREIGPPDRGLPATPAGVDDPRVREVQRAWASRVHGAVDRSDGQWHWRYGRPDALIQGWLLGDPAAPEGWLCIEHQDRDLFVLDRAFLTPAAARRAWGLLADHATVFEHARWIGPAVDPWLFHLPDRHHALKDLSWFYLRVVDAVGALQQRGYPPDLTAHLDLELDDPDLPANAGRWRLSVREGRGTLTRGGDGHLRATPRGLAGLYAGLLHPRQLRELGLLDGDERALLTARRLFDGGAPWVLERW